MCLFCALTPCIIKLSCKTQPTLQQDVCTTSDIFYAVFKHMAASSFFQGADYPLNNSLYSPLLAELKSFVNNPHADRWGHTATAARRAHIHLAEEVESQQFFSESADSTDRVNESSDRETKAVYHAHHWGWKHCNAGLIFAQVAFPMQFRCFSISYIVD